MHKQTGGSEHMPFAYSCIQTDTSTHTYIKLAVYVALILSPTCLFLFPRHVLQSVHGLILPTFLQ